MRLRHGDGTEKISCEANATIRQVKKHIVQKKLLGGNVEASGFRLKVGGSLESGGRDLLNEERSLEDEKVKDGDLLVVVLLSQAAVQMSPLKNVAAALVEAKSPGSPQLGGLQLEAVHINSI